MQFEAVMDDLTEENQDSVTSTELAEMLGWSRTTVETFRPKRQGATKLYKSPETTTDPDTIFPEDIKDMLKEKVMEVLSPMELDILTRGHGLAGRQQETLIQLARFYKISRERVRQIENGALRKLYASMYPIVNDIEI